MSVKTWNNLTKHLQTFLSNQGLESEDLTSIMDSWANEKSTVLKMISNGAVTHKRKDPNAPKKWCSSYIWFCRDVRNTVKEDNPDMKATEVLKEMGNMWRNLSDKKKAKYQKEADKDKARYLEEMKGYTPPETTDEEPTKSRKKKVNDGPKKPMSAYLFYCKDARTQLKEDNPDMKATDVTREMGAMWRKLSDDEKVLFQEQAAKDKERYEEECKAAGLRDPKPASETKAKPAKAKPSKAKPSKAKPAKANKAKPAKKAPEPEPEEDSEVEVEPEEVKEPSKGKRKQRLTGYILFCQENRPIVKEDNPKWKSPQITKELSKQWKALDDEGRDEFNDRALAGETPATK